MRKAQVVSALALVLAIGGNIPVGAYASEEVAAPKATNVTKDAAEAVANTPASADSVASKYPGLDKYLNNLAGQYDAHSNDPQYMAALSEATEAARLLKGLGSTPKQAVTAAEQAETTATPAVDNAASRSAAKAKPVAHEVNNTVVPAAGSAQAAEKEPGVQLAEQIAANISVKVAEKPAVAESKAEPEDAPKAEESATEEKSGATDEVELPNTGTEKKIGVGEMVLVSTAVVVATVGASLMVLRSRKK